MGLSFLASFVFPGLATLPASDQLPGIFSPVSRPVRALTGMLYRHFHAEPVADDLSPQKPREHASVYEENHQLLTALASLQAKFDQLSQLNADRQAVGDIRPLCKPATVTGGEPLGLRESLNITAGPANSMLMGRPVIRGNPSQSPLPCDLVGRVVHTGVAGAQVRLVTDPGFKLVGRIGRYVPQPEGLPKLVWVEKLHPVVCGIGHNAMTINLLTMKQVEDNGIAVNDMVVLDDPDWPRNIQGFEVGRIVSIGRQARAPLLADIRIEPVGNLMRLTEVMVMVRD